jgi:hypothetical protein
MHLIFFFFFFFCFFVFLLELILVLEASWSNLNPIEVEIGMCMWPFLDYPTIKLFLV